MINMPSVMMGPMMFQMTLWKTWLDAVGLAEKMKPKPNEESRTLGFDSFGSMVALNPFLDKVPGFRQWTKMMEDTWKSIESQAKSENDLTKNLFASNPLMFQWMKAFYPTF